MKYCAVRGCPPGRPPAVTYHRVPAEGNPQRSIWLEACNIRNAEGRGRLNICSKHFEEEDFNNPTTAGAVPSRRSARFLASRVSIATTTTTTRRTLRPGAVPSMYLHADDFADLASEPDDDAGDQVHEVTAAGDQGHPSSQVSHPYNPTHPAPFWKSPFQVEGLAELERKSIYAASSRPCKKV